MKELSKNMIFMILSVNILYFANLKKNISVGNKHVKSIALNFCPALNIWRPLYTGILRPSIVTVNGKADMLIWNAADLQFLTVS